MIDRDFAKKQAKRFSGLDFFPNDASGFGEIVTAIEHAASSEQSCRDYVDQWLAYNTQCPKPATIRAALVERAAALRKDRARCKLCDGNTFIGRDYIVTFETNQRLRPVSKKPLVSDWRDEERHGKTVLAANQDIVGGAHPCPACRPNYVGGSL